MAYSIFKKSACDNIRQPQCRPVHRGRPAHTQRMIIQLPEVYPRIVRPTERAPLELKIQMLRAEVLETRCCTAMSRGARARATATRCAEPTTGSRFTASSVGESTIAPTTRFPIWTRLSRREVRAWRRPYAGGGGPCLRDLWRAWRIRDYRRA